METFYFLFHPNMQNWQLFHDSGFAIGFIIVFFSSLIVTAFYYLVLGNSSGKNSTIGKWLLFLFINMFIVLILTIILEFKILDVANGTLELKNDVWIFSVLNGAFYSIIWYLIDSLILNNFSTFSRFIPFNIFK